MTLRYFFMVMAILMVPLTFILSYSLVKLFRDGQGDRSTKEVYGTGVASSIIAGIIFTLAVLCSEDVKITFIASCGIVLGYILVQILLLRIAVWLAYKKHK